MPYGRYLLPALERAIGRPVNYGELRDCLGVTLASVSRLVNGHRSLTIDHLVKLAHWYDVPARSLLMEIMRAAHADAFARPEQLW